MILSTSFYAITIFVIFAICDRNFSITSFLWSIFAPIDGMYGFVLEYLILMIISPLYNYIMHHVSRTSHLCICIVLFILFSVLPTGINYTKIIYIPSAEIFSGTFLYFFAGYIRFYVTPRNGSRIWVILTTCLVYILSVIDVFYFNDQVMIRESSAIASVIIPMGLFLSCYGSNFRSRIVNKISGLVFGVYLIHENYYIRQWLWGYTSSLELYNSIYYPLLGISIALIIFVVCALIEYIRQKTIQRLLDKPIDIISCKLQDKLDSITRKLSEKIHQKSESQGQVKD